MYVYNKGQNIEPLPNFRRNPIASITKKEQQGEIASNGFKCDKGSAVLSVHWIKGTLRVKLLKLVSSTDGGFWCILTKRITGSIVLSWKIMLLTWSVIVSMQHRLFAASELSKYCEENEFGSPLGSMRLGPELGSDCANAGSCNLTWTDTLISKFKSQDCSKKQKFAGGVNPSK